MAYRILRRKEAMDYCLTEGYKKFINLAITDKIIVLEDEAPQTLEQKFALALQRSGYKPDDIEAISDILKYCMK